MGIPPRQPYPPHPAQYSDEVINAFAILIWEHDLHGTLVLDPFAGCGVQIDRLPVHSIKIELQHGWAKQAARGMVQGDATSLPFAEGVFDVIITSPVFGNRMSDKHKQGVADKSKRITYKHYLDRADEELDSRNAGGMQWGKAYKELHRKAWAESVRVLKPGGMFMLNVSDHIRGGERQHVSRWHMLELVLLDMQYLTIKTIPTKRMRYGANGETRVSSELVIVLRKK